MTVISVNEIPLQVRSGSYRLELLPDRPFARLLDAEGGGLAELFYLSGVDSTAGQDDTSAVGTWSVQQLPDQVILSLSAKSSTWRSKIYRFRCFEERLEYEIEVCGDAQVTDIHYFGGFCSANIRWGSGFFASGQQFQRGFNPEPNTLERLFFSAGQSEAIDLMGVPLPGRGDWFFTPPPFCLAFEHSSGWLGIGIKAEAGNHLYTRFCYHGLRDSFHLSLACEGYLPIRGEGRLPAVSIVFAVDPYAVLQEHVRWTDQRQAAGAVSGIHAAAWWYGPIFCGWGAQCYLAKQRRLSAPEMAEQAHYKGFLRNLRVQNLHPRIVVIDDKWQAEYGTNRADTQKWPDMPAFMRQCHQNGQKVLLWLKAWDPQGLPAAECITNAAGLPIAADPTNPLYQARARQMVTELLSPSGLDADGFKIDFSARIPSGPGMLVYGQAWGLELMRAYLSLIHTAAKAVKPDALVISHTPHPYLADVVDMIRLNDINTAHPVSTAMRHRAMVARIACPQALIDTDNWPMPNKAAWAEYTALQPEIGVPALYYDVGIDATGEKFTEQDYAIIRKCWNNCNWK